MRMSKFCKALVILAFAFGALSATTKPNIEGTWIMESVEGFARPLATPLNETLRDAYNFAKDDPSLLCIPASWTRVYSNPNTPIEIRFTDHQVEIDYELFDIRRTIPLYDPAKVGEVDWSDPKFPTLGKNVGWVEGDELVVVTGNYGDENRILSTIRGWAGLYQSPLMVTEERYRRLSDRQLGLTITHFDPLMYREPLKVDYQLNFETEWSVEHYGCTPEDAFITTLSD